MHNVFQVLLYNLADTSAATPKQQQRHSLHLVPNPMLPLLLLLLCSAVLHLQPFTGNKTVVTDRLPGDRWHGRRVLRFSPEGLLVLAVGVPCNVCKLNRTAEGIQFGSMYSLNTTSGELRQMATGRHASNHACVIERGLASSVLAVHMGSELHVCRDSCSALMILRVLRSALWGIGSLPHGMHHALYSLNTTSGELRQMAAGRGQQQAYVHVTSC
jgi:hypothetical protein